MGWRPLPYDSYLSHSRPWLSLAENLAELLQQPFSLTEQWSIVSELLTIRPKKALRSLTVTISCDLDRPQD